MAKNRISRAAPRRHISFNEEVKQVSTFAKVDLMEIATRIRHLVSLDLEIQKEQMKIITVLSEQDFENLIYTVLDNEYELVKEISIESECDEDNQNENVAQAIKSLKSITE